MKSPFGLFILFSLILPFSIVINARKDTGEYWRAVMKDQPMPEAKQGLIRASTLSSVSNEKADCHTTESNEKNNFVRDFGPQLYAASYDNGIKQTKEKSFSEDFDPSPNIPVYSDGVVKGERSFAEDFEPRPNVSVYHDDATLKGEKFPAEDFERKPNVSVHGDGVGLKGKEKLFSDDFEPRPSATAYSN